MIIRPATPDDIVRMVAIAQESPRSRWSEAAFTQEFSLAWSKVFVAEEQSVKGYLVSWWIADEIEILHIAVTKNARRQGIGKALLHFLMQAGKSKRISLEVSAENQPAYHLYADLGFTICGKRLRYYFNTETKLYEDALIMECQR